MNSTSPMAVGATVALTCCTAYNAHHDEVQISGLFEIIEYHPVEPSAFVFSPTFTVLSEDGFEYDVDAGDLQEQVMPREHGKDLVMEREMELAAEAMEEAIES
jgi:hypothetical protein